jgi:hypothetical protein
VDVGMQVTGPLQHTDHKHKTHKIDAEHKNQRFEAISAERELAENSD